MYPVEGSSQPTQKWSEKQLIKMSFGKTAGFSGIVAETLESSGSGETGMIRELLENTISVNHILSE